MALLIVFPAAFSSAEEVTEDVQIAIVGTNGSDVIENTTPSTASADIDTDSDDNVLTSATGIDALQGNDEIGNTSSLTAEGESRVDIPTKYSTTKAEARSTGITGGPGHDSITNSTAITTRSMVNTIIGNFLMMMTDIGVTGCPTTSTADSTGIDGGTGLDTVTSSGSIYVFAQADSTVSQGTLSVVEVPVDAFSLGDARTEATSTAAGIRGGDFHMTGGQPESLANSGVMTIHSKATATADKFVLEAVGAARIDGSTTADASAAGIEGGTRNNTITNGNKISVTAEAEARFAATQLKMNGLMLKPLLKLFGLDVGKISTTATAEAVGIDGGSGNDTITNSETAQTIDVYGKATAHSQ